MLSTDRQTDKLTNATKKHNLLYQGGNKHFLFTSGAVITMTAKPHIPYNILSAKQKVEVW